MSGSASTLIPPPAKGPQLRKEEYRTGDIMKVVQDIVRGYAHETEKFSRQFSRHGLNFRLASRRLSPTSYLCSPASFVQGSQFSWSFPA